MKEMRRPLTMPHLVLLLALFGCSGEQQEKLPGVRLLEVNGCLACHSLDGSKGIGPTLKGLFNSEVVVNANGTKRTLKADRDYLKRSILEPQTEVVEGFRPNMPTHFKTQLGEKDLNTILDYLESLGGTTVTK